MSKQTAFLTLVYVRTYYKPFKVGFSVSKKVGKSVVRSLVKRRMSECFNLLYEHLNPNYNYIFVAKNGISQISFDQLKNEMQKVLTKAGLYI